MITINHQKESLSRSLIQAIAGRCGMICSYREFDYGIDVKVCDVIVRTDRAGSAHETRRYVESGFDIAIQAKSTTQFTIEDDAIVYDLEAKNYNDLRDTDVGTPRILVLLLLPSDEGQWLNLTEDQIILRRCAYWYSVLGSPETNNNSTVRIRIPRANLFTVDALNLLMQRRKDGLVL